MHVIFVSHVVIVVAAERGCSKGGCGSEEAQSMGERLVAIWPAVLSRSPFNVCRCCTSYASCMAAWHTKFGLGRPRATTFFEVTIRTLFIFYVCVSATVNTFSWIWWVIYATGTRMTIMWIDFLVILSFFPRSILTGWGKHSKVAGASAVKKAVETRLMEIGAPFQVAKYNEGRLISAGRVVYNWLRDAKTLPLLLLQDSRQAPYPRREMSMPDLRLLSLQPP